MSLRLLFFRFFSSCFLFVQEEKKGKLPSGLVLQSCSFFANISLFILFLLALLSSPSDYWELWVCNLPLVWPFELSFIYHKNDLIDHLDTEN